ncbi:MAG: hypothetical protein N2560_03240 [Ignavibacteria bacterium]|nr:hypothetical protein [Ignavibacteria bacterium]
MRILFQLSFFFFPLLLFSQVEYYSFSNETQFQVGFFITGKGCVNTVEPPQGIKNDFQLSKTPDFGAKFSYKFKETETKLFVDISYLSAYMKYKLYNNPSTNWISEFHYINIGFGFEFSYFLLSLNFGLPTSGKFSLSPNFSINYDSKDLNSMLQIRIGTNIPIIKDKIGNLYFVVFADYFLVGALKQDNNYNPRIASLSLGLNYMFNL